MIVGIACIKNELDIVEPWVRHTLNWCSQIIVTDGSVDGTREVLLQLKQEFPTRLTILNDEGVGDRQSERMTRLLRLAALFTPDYIIPLDCDEFLDGDIGNLSLIPPGGCGMVPWRNYVADGDSCADPPRSIRWRRVEERPPYWKAILNMKGVTDVQNLVVIVGNHEIVRGCQRLVKVDLPDLRLLHYPVRSRNQIIAKSVISWPCLLMSGIGKRGDGLAYHRQALFDLITSGAEIDVCEQSRIYAQFERPELMEDEREWSYERKYTNGQPMPMMQLVARAWEEAVK